MHSSDRDGLSSTFVSTCCLQKVDFQNADITFTQKIHPKMRQMATLAGALLVVSCRAFTFGVGRARFFVGLTTRATTRPSSDEDEIKQGLRVIISRDLSSESYSRDLQVRYGETSGAALLIEKTMLSRGPEDILSDVNWRVLPNERWGIVGPNG